MFVNFYKSAVGKKVVVALTGLFLIFFVVGHMAGNLKFFGSVNLETGQHTLDHYGHMLRAVGSDFIGNYTFLWIFRILLILSVILHVVTVILLSRQNRLARNAEYDNQKYRSATLASRTMLAGGLLLLCFIIFHILHFTTGDLHFRGYVFGDVFNNVVSAFADWYMVAIYVFAMLWLCLHIYHGAWSAFQTLGIDNPTTNVLLRNGARLLAILLFLGFSIVPLAAHFGGYSLLPPQAHTQISDTH